MKKICIKCKKNKPLEDYYKDSGHKDGRYSQCKSCSINKSKEYLKTEKGKLAHARSEAKYRKTEKYKLTQARAKIKYNKSDKGKLSQAKYAKSNKGRLTQARYIKSGKGKLKRAEYKKSDRGKLANAKYEKSGKGKVSRARADHNRKINISNSTSTLTDKEFNCILFLQNYQCIHPDCDYYFDKVKPQKDHIMPISKGGNFTKETVQALCKEHNSKKGTKYIDYRSDIHKEMIAKMAHD